METEIEKLNKLDAIIEPPTVIGPYTLRPFTAASMIMLRKVKNIFILSEGNADDVAFHAASFIYIHAANLDEVRLAIFNYESFQKKVLEFSETLRVEDLFSAVPKIRQIIERAAASLNYEVEGNEKEDDPNS